MITDSNSGFPSQYSYGYFKFDAIYHTGLRRQSKAIKAICHFCGNVSGSDYNFPSFTYLLTYFRTYLLAPWSKVLLEKLTGSQPVKKFPAFYRTRSFIPAYTSARHLFLSWASSIQSITPYPTSWRSTNLVHSLINYMHKIVLLRVCCNSEGKFDPGKEWEHLCYINWLSGCYRRWLIVTDVAERHTVHLGSLMMRWDCSS